MGSIDANVRKSSGKRNSVTNFFLSVGLLFLIPLGIMAWLEIGNVIKNTDPETVRLGSYFGAFLALVFFSIPLSTWIRIKSKQKNSAHNGLLSDEFKLADARIKAGKVLKKQRRQSWLRRTFTFMPQENRHANNHEDLLDFHEINLALRRCVMNARQEQNLGIKIIYPPENQKNQEVIELDNPISSLV